MAVEGVLFVEEMLWVKSVLSMEGVLSVEGLAAGKRRESVLMVGGRRTIGERHAIGGERVLVKDVMLRS